MKVGMDKLSRMSRLAFLILFGSILSKYLRLFRHGVDILEYWYTLLLALPFFYAGALAWFYYAPAELTEEGVYVQWFLRRSFYPWQSIRQALVLESRSRNWEHDLILVPPQGSPRKPGESNTIFRLRNHFRLVYLPATAELVRFVRSVYGDPSCDQSRGIWDG